MKVTIDVNTNGAAYADDPDHELASALGRMAARIIGMGMSEGAVTDSNGAAFVTFEVTDR